MGIMAEEHEGEAPETDTGQQAEDQQGQSVNAEAPEGGEAETFDIDFGDGAAPAPGERDSSTIREMRERIRELSRENSQLRQTSAPQQIEIGPRPTLESCEFDEDKFAAAYDEWQAKKAKAEQQKASAGQVEQEAQEAFQRDVQSYQAKRAKLPFVDVDEVEGVALAALNQVQQAVIVKAADDPAKVLYALGKRPDKLAEISQFQDPLKLAAAIARLEGGLNVVKRSKAPAPEEIAQGSQGMSQGTDDKEEARLLKDAEKSGDYSAYYAHLRSKRKAA